jgi:hypothetical protein
MHQLAGWKVSNGSFATHASARDVWFTPNADAQSRLNTTEANQPVTIANIAVARP